MSRWVLQGCWGCSAVAPHVKAGLRLFKGEQQSRSVSRRRLAIDRGRQIQYFRSSRDWLMNEEILPGTRCTCLEWAGGGGGGEQKGELIVFLSPKLWKLFRG